MKKSLIALLLAGFTLNSFAANPVVMKASDDDDNGCRYLNIQIANNTGNTCILTPHYLHGNIAERTNVPRSLMNGQSSHFVMSQTIYGPDVILDVDCGDRSASIESQQNLCFIMAGSIHGSVKQAKNIDATFNAYNGSAWFSRHGTIDWLLQ